MKGNKFDKSFKIKIRPPFRSPYGERSLTRYRLEETNMVYSDLFREMKDDDNKLRAGFDSNHVSNLRLFMAELQRSETDLIRFDLLVSALEFNVVLERFSEKLRSRNYSKSTTDGIYSRIKKVREFALSRISKVESGGKNFGDTFRALITQNGISVENLAQKMDEGIKSLPIQNLARRGNKRKMGSIEGQAGTIRSWINHRCFPEYMDDVEVIEAVLGVKRGVLTSLLPLTKRRDNSIIPQTKYGRRLTILSRMPYSLSYKNFPDTAKAEIALLTAHKTNQSIYSRESSSGKAWNSPMSAKKAIRMMKRIYGFALLSPNIEEPMMSGCGLPVEDLSLSLFADPHFLTAYIEFAKLRIGNYNSEHCAVLMIAAMLLRKDTGLLWRDANNMFSAAYTRRTKDTADWRTHCEELRNYYTTVLSRLADAATKSRDPFEDLALILNQQHPIESLWVVRDSLLRDASLYEKLEVLNRNYVTNRVRRHTKRPIRERGVVLRSGGTPFVAVLIRNATMFAMESEIPFRTDNVSQMKLHENLYQKPGDPRYWVRFPVETIKNDKAFDAPYTLETSKLIDRYLKHYRKQFPHFKDGLELPYVFLTTDRPSMCNAERISLIIKAKMCDYIGVAAGGHAIRHIVATEYVKNSPDGVALAAKALHDAEETVRKEYCRFLPEDGIAWLHTYKQKLIEKLQDSDVRNIPTVKCLSKLSNAELIDRVIELERKRRETDSQWIRIRKVV
jgi:hypothetical protein